MIQYLLVFSCWNVSIKNKKEPKTTLIRKHLTLIKYLLEIWMKLRNLNFILHLNLDAKFKKETIITIENKSRLHLKQSYILRLKNLHD